MPKEEKVIVIDLSKKISFGNYYISVGSLLLCLIPAVLLFLKSLCSHNWVLEPEDFDPFIALVASIRSSVREETKDDTKVLSEKEDKDDTNGK